MPSEVLQIQLKCIYFLCKQKPLILTKIQLTLQTHSLPAKFSNTTCPKKLSLEKGYTSNRIPRFNVTVKWSKCQLNPESQVPWIVSSQPSCSPYFWIRQQPFLIYSNTWSSEGVLVQLPSSKSVSSQKELRNSSCSRDELLDKHYQNGMMEPERNNGNTGFEHILKLVKVTSLIPGGGTPTIMEIGR